MPNSGCSHKCDNAAGGYKCECPDLFTWSQKAASTRVYICLTFFGDLFIISLITNISKEAFLHFLFFWLDLSSLCNITTHFDSH